MSKQAADHHKKAAEHHEHAARHHREAAKHHEAGAHEKAAHHADVIVSCLHCRRVVTLASEVGAAELTRLQAHLFVCVSRRGHRHSGECRGDPQALPRDLDDEPPPAA